MTAIPISLKGIGTMDESSEFTEFIRRIRAGDDQAAYELVERYEPVIRRAVRVRLRDPRLICRFDCRDVSQSVMASFFVRAAAGQFDLEQPAHLARILVVMAQREVAKQVRRHRADRRDYRRSVVRDPDCLERQLAAVHSPSRLVAGRELLEEFRRRLTDEERQLADLRAEGYKWAEIAGRLGGTPGARSKQLVRALDRIEQHFDGSRPGDA
jgi:RNA polymerase sigma-70 factor (ECF subfamily)